MTAMFAAASSFFSRTNISANYTIGGPSTTTSNTGPTNPNGVPSPRTTTPTPSTPGGGSTTASAPLAPTFRVGPWRVQAATHRGSGKRVSVWDCDKRSGLMERLGPSARERALEVLKAEVRVVARVRRLG
jgi:SCY1-like protein 2